MNPKLQALWDNTMQRLQAVSDGLESRGAVPMSDNFPLLGSFAEDEPEAHASARGRILENLEWGSNAAGSYSLPKENLPLQDIKTVLERREVRVQLDLRISVEWNLSSFTAPKSAVSFCAA
jgi:hypothetical protein